MRRLAISGVDPMLRRAAVFGTAVLTTGLATLELRAVLSLNGLGIFEALLLVLFAVSFLWISLSFWTSLVGFFALLTRWRPQGLARPKPGRTLESRTAILMPVYNEDPREVFARVQAMHEALADTGEGEVFDVFILSDTTDPKVWLAEQQAWFDLTRARAGQGGAIYYRRRSENRARKSGNIADFCRRWGARYDFMVVLDADSLMTADTLVELARIMEANPSAGLLQVPPTLINRRSLFARMQQFASALATPVLARGLAFWQLGEGNFWGHNAIIRVRAFTECCGLPNLPGQAPFGGLILSHDFVEAALLRRGGWKVWMVPELGGSYEESPPTVLDFAVRDRRWCQGNLQHMKILVAKGLHPISRLHLAMGVMSYAASPLWLVFLLVGLAAAVETHLAKTRYFMDHSPFPVWPQSDPWAAIQLFALAMAMLFAPKLFSLLAILLDGRRARLFGGRLRATGSLILELIFSTLIAPAMMLFHTSFVLEVLIGRDSGWGSQRREEGKVSLREAFDRHRAQVLAGILLASVFIVLPQSLGWWFSPLAAGLILAPLLSFATASLKLGDWMGRLGIFRIPEETEPLPVLRRAREILAASRVSEVEGSALQALAADPKRLALHRALIAGSGEMPAPQALVSTAVSRLEAGRQLDGKEEAAVMTDLGALDRAVRVLSAPVPTENPGSRAAA